MANLEPQATFVDRFAGMIIIDELVNIYLNICHNETTVDGLAIHNRLAVDNFLK